MKKFFTSIFLGALLSPILVNALSANCIDFDLQLRPRDVAERNKNLLAPASTSFYPVMLRGVGFGQVTETVQTHQPDRTHIHPRTSSYTWKGPSGKVIASAERTFTRVDTDENGKKIEVFETIVQDCEGKPLSKIVEEKTTYLLNDKSRRVDMTVQYTVMIGDKEMGVYGSYYPTYPYFSTLTPYQSRRGVDSASLIMVGVLDRKIQASLTK